METALHCTSGWLVANITCQSLSEVVFCGAIECSDLSRRSASYLVFHIREVFLAFARADLSSAISCSYFNISAQSQQKFRQHEQPHATRQHTCSQWRGRHGPVATFGIGAAKGSMADASVYGKFRSRGDLC